jgi:hypothetical protein
MMLVMYPNGALARSDRAPEGCIIVPEPDIIPIEKAVIDQTQAVLDSMYHDRKS